jgi:predicted hydrocarbon binding protein/KaiC/GvpD/RAD55 family RecA-like ATPase
VMVSLSQLQEVPPRNVILLVGPPGSGKTTFCQQSILQNIAMDRPIIYVMTEYGPSEAEKDLKERGLARVEPGMLNYVDAYNETVGVAVSDRVDTIHADCNDLSSIDIAITKLTEQIGKKDVLLVFDSLSSPYLFIGSETLRFIRQTLSRFAAKGNAVLACMDKGCGKPEDLVAMMTLCNGVIETELIEGKKVIKVVKHPRTEPTKIEISLVKVNPIYDMKVWDQEMMRYFLEAQQKGDLSKEFGEYDVNGFWLNLGKWSAILWDPKRIREMSYELLVEMSSLMREMIPMFPWYTRLIMKMMMPKSFSKPKDMKKLLKFVDQQFMKGRRYGIMEYLDDVSKTDEHYIRIYENSECWGFQNVGAATATMIPAMIVGLCRAFEKEKRNWNAVETKCIGLGDPYCEIKVVPGEIDELKDSLRAIDNKVLDAMHDRLMDQLIDFMLRDKPLWERPMLGSTISLAETEMNLFPMASERYRVALRMGGTKSGREVSEHLKDEGVEGDEAVKHVLNLLEHCKVGKVTMGETIKIENSFDSMFTKFMTTKLNEPSCYFTTGFLNGFFSAVKNLHLKETKCIAMGDPYCEWEFR